MIRGTWIAALVGAAVPLAGAAEPLAPFLAIHRQANARAESKEWAEAAKVYAAFAAKGPADPGTPLALLFQGILLRRELKQPGEARAAFARVAALPDDYAGGALIIVARRWLAWFQMAEIDAALREHFVERVEYPKTLDALVERKLVRPEQIVDPWGKRFVYAEAKSRIVPKMPWQNYTLRAAAIEADSKQFKSVLEASVGFGRTFQLKAVRETRPLMAIIEAGERVKKLSNVAEGETVDSARLVKLTRDAAILVDREQIAVLMVPR